MEETQMNVAEQTVETPKIEKDEENAMLSNGETVFMQTAQAEIHNPKSSASVTERILLDCGSQRTYISQSLVDKLRLKKQHVEELRVFTFGGKEAKVIKTHVTTIKLKLKNGQFLCLDANIVPVISGNIQRKALNEDYMDNFRDLADSLDLADTFPDKSETSEIELLIGNDYYLDLVLQQRIEIYSGLYLLCTRLGWVLTGRSKTDLNDNNIPSMLILTHGSTYVNKSEVCGIDNPVKPLHELEDFWNIEAIGIHDKDKKDDDELSMKRFEEILTFENGRYNVTWPWKEDIPELPQNKELAFGRLRSCLKRLKNKPEMLEKYDYVIKDQLCKGVIEKVTDRNDKNHMCHYLPHHAVITPRKSTKKLRVVYDASAKVSKEAKNLNENLCRGPVLLRDLCGLLMRFRLYNVAMVAYIEKAFLQIGFQESERDVTRFFWVKDTKNASVFPDNIDIYRFCRVPFGIIASPFLLNATIEAHLKLYNTDLAKKLKNDIYVDNIISGANTDEDAMVMYSGANCMFKDASMNLREWISNSEKVNSFIPEVDRSSESQPQVLGHIWDHKADTLSVKPVKINEDNSKLTKRIVLKNVAFVFDPMGLFSPLILQGKVLLQTLWESGLDWDTTVTDKIIHEKWFIISKQLPLISDIKLNQNICSREKCVHYNLICFCDASTKAYATAIYLQQEYESTAKTDLIFAKTRLAPVKKMTIPRLELMAVLIGIRCLMFVKTQLMLKISQQFLWTDSQVVIEWIKSEKQLPVFVKNRVAEIKIHKDVSIAYVNTKENPADIATRGLSMTDLQVCSLWWRGPSWCSETSKSWKSEDENSDETENGQKGTKNLDLCVTCVNAEEIEHTTVKPPCGINIQRFPTLTKL